MKYIRHVHIAEQCYALPTTLYFLADQNHITVIIFNPFTDNINTIISAAIVDNNNFNIFVADGIKGT